MSTHDVHKVTRGCEIFASSANHITFIQKNSLKASSTLYYTPAVWKHWVFLTERPETQGTFFTFTMRTTSLNYYIPIPCQCEIYNCVDKHLHKKDQKLVLNTFS